MVVKRGRCTMKHEQTSWTKGVEKIHNEAARKGWTQEKVEEEIDKLYVRLFE